MRTAALTFSVLVLVAVLAGCGGSSAKSVSAPSGSVAKVGDQTITVDELNQLLASAKSSYAQQKQTFPKKGTAAYKTLLGQAVGYLVQASVLEQEAKKLGVGVTDKQVTNAIATLKQQNFGGSEQKYQAALKAQGVTEKSLRSQELLQLSETAIQTKVTADAKVTDAQAKAYYAKHPSSYKSPATRSVRHILVAKKALADSLYAKLKAGASFATLAKKYSTDSGSKASGGKLTDTKGTFVAPFEKVAFSLKTNEISKPVHSQFGWHIIQALAPVKPAGVQPYSAVAASIKSTLLQKAQSTALQAWTKKTYASYCDGQIAYGKGYSSPFCTSSSASTTSTSTGATTTTG